MSNLGKQAIEVIKAAGPMADHVQRSALGIVSTLLSGNPPVAGEVNPRRQQLVESLVTLLKEEKPEKQKAALREAREWLNRPYQINLGSRAPILKPKDQKGARK